MRGIALGRGFLYPRLPLSTPEVIHRDLVAISIRLLADTRAFTALIVLGANAHAGCHRSMPENATAAAPQAVRPADPRKISFRYEVEVEEVPATARQAYLWVPIPPTDREQTVHRISVDSAAPYVEVPEPRFGNRAMRFELKSGLPSQNIALEFELTRHAPGRGSAAPKNARVDDPQSWLAPDRLVPIDGFVDELARRITAGEEEREARARAIYDYVVREMSYDKSGIGWGNGDIYWACDTKRGNCTDFHSLFIGCARALGIPTRFEMGFPIPTDRSSGEIAGYHCWAQFHLDDRGWVPVDASEARKHPHKKEFFFGGHGMDRILLSAGRDLVFEGMLSGPMNYFIYPHVEVDGEKWSRVNRRFSYRDIHQENRDDLS